MVNKDFQKAANNLPNSAKLQALASSKRTQTQTFIL